MQDKEDERAANTAAAEAMPSQGWQESKSAVPTVPRSRKRSPAGQGKKISEASLPDLRSRLPTVAPSVQPIALGMVGFSSR